MLKLKKSELRRDTVASDKFHVGIELETIAPCLGGESEHDDDACHDSQRQSMIDEGAEYILRDHIGVSREYAESLSPYFNTRQWVDDYMQDWTCDNSDCGYWSESGSPDGTRESCEFSLSELVANPSVKVVSDGSISVQNDNETDAEVCWNYMATKECLKDNAKILGYLKVNGHRFNKSCGLHINLNNYLRVEGFNINTEKLAFLFNLVGQSRRESTYCTRYAISTEQKYSMIYHQGDRLEFRFFSPTFEAAKLNAYVAIAHFIYKRLAGKNVKLSKRLRAFFMEKMTKINGHSEAVAKDTLDKIEAIPAIATLAYAPLPARPVGEDTSEVEAANPVQNAVYYGLTPVAANAAAS